MMRHDARERGFTLLEIMLAVAITAGVMTMVAGTFIATLQAREEVEALSESTRAGPRILAMIERDLDGLWHHNIKDNKVLLGRNRDISGFDADRIDFITTTDAIGVVIDAHSKPQRPSLCEVGYWLKENPRYPDLRELWRREDPMVDGDLTTGGTFQLVHDRIKNFNITYFSTLGAKAEPLNDWDSSQNDELPRRLMIEFTIERELANRNRVTGAETDDFEDTIKKYTRHIVFDHRYPDILKADIAMLPVIPGRPLADEGDGTGPLGPAGGGGPSTTAGGVPPGFSGQGLTGDPSAVITRGRATVQESGGGRRAPGAAPPPGAAINLGDLLRGGGGSAGGLFGSGGPFGKR